MSIKRFRAPLIRYSKRFERYDLVWVQYDLYPWWPAIIIDEDDFMMDEELPDMKPNQRLAQFFDEGISVCAIDDKCIRPFFPFLEYFCTEKTSEDIKRAVQEARVYFEVISGESQSDKYIPRSPVRNDKAKGKSRSRIGSRVRKKRLIQECLDNEESDESSLEPKHGRNKRRSVGEHASSTSKKKSRKARLTYETSENPQAELNDSEMRDTVREFDSFLSEGGPRTIGKDPNDEHEDTSFGTARKSSKRTNSNKNTSAPPDSSTEVMMMYKPPVNPESATEVMMTYKPPVNR